MRPGLGPRAVRGSRPRCPRRDLPRPSRPRSPPGRPVRPGRGRGSERGRAPIVRFRPASDSRWRTSASGRPRHGRRRGAPAGCCRRRRRPYVPRGAERRHLVLPGLLRGGQGREAVQGARGAPAGHAGSLRAPRLGVDRVNRHAGGVRRLGDGVEEAFRVYPRNRDGRRRTGEPLSSASLGGARPRRRTRRPPRGCRSRSASPYRGGPRRADPAPPGHDHRVVSGPQGSGRRSRARARPTR